MKKLTLFAAITINYLLLTVSLFSQPRLNDSVGQACLPEGITFTTQAQIDQFQTNYPSCTEIEGSVQINGFDIENLYGLSVLTSIGGTLEIGSNQTGICNQSLTDLSGLDNLTFIGSNLDICRNIVLQSLEGLDNVTSIGGSLNIMRNTDLISLSGLGNLIDIGGSIQIYLNESLVSISGLENINSIVGNLTIGIINLGGNPSLINLSGLDNMVSIGGTFRLDQNNALNSIASLNNLTFIGGSLYIYSNDLTTLSGLDNVSSIGGDISINEIELASVAALANLTEIEGGLYLGGPWGSYSELTSLTGFDNVTSIGGNLMIMNLDSLTSFTGLDKVTSIGGNLQIWNNDALATLSGLDSLTSIGGNLEIGWLYYWPRGNPSLSSLEQLVNLTSIVGNIIIIYNDTLTSLAGLENIDAGSITELNIYSNNLLSTCEVQSICDYLANPNGYITIYDNASGCNSPEEVQEACDSITSVEKLNSEEKFTISPNPCSDELTITWYQPEAGHTSIEIYNSMGKRIEVVVSSLFSVGDLQYHWNADGLKSGVYYIKLQVNNSLSIKKIIKLK